MSEKPRLKTKASKYKGVTMFRDRHGKIRWRARMKGKRDICLPGEFESAEFIAAWEAWYNAPATERPEGWVYFVVGIGTGLVKIGFSADPDARFATLKQQAAVTYRLVTAVPGTMATEKELHARFKAKHSHGEWFQYDEEMYQFVKGLAEQHGPTPWRDRKKRKLDVPGPTNFDQVLEL